MHLECLLDHNRRTTSSEAKTFLWQVTHATPAALYAKTADRKWECDTNMPDHRTEQVGMIMDNQRLSCRRGTSPASWWRPRGAPRWTWSLAEAWTPSFQQTKQSVKCPATDPRVGRGVANMVGRMVATWLVSGRGDILMARQSSPGRSSYTST